MNPPIHFPDVGLSTLHNDPSNNSTDAQLTSSSITFNEFESKCARLNVGGTSFRIMRSRLVAYPDTKLGKFALAEEAQDAISLCDGYLRESDEYYFDRSHCTFDWILNLYRMNSLHLPEHRCPLSFLDDLKYWGIDRSLLAPCCEGKLVDSLNYFKNQNPNLSPSESDFTSLPTSLTQFTSPVLDNSVDDNTMYPLRRVSIASQPTIERRRSTFGRKVSIMSSGSRRKSSAGPLGVATKKGATISDKARRGTIFIDPEAFSGKLCGGSRRKLWTFLEQPTSSKQALVFSCVSLGFIVATVILLVLSSLPSYQHWDPVANISMSDPALDVGDTACVAWFTFEYLLRLWGAPSRLDYIREPLSIIDIVAVLPFYFELFLTLFGVESKIFGDLRRSLLLIRILRLLRLLRVLRILKVARYSSGFQSMGTTLKRSYKELVLLILFMTTANILFSTMMYFLEWEQPNTKFYSIPAASWWCIITMTTVGYGDIYPTSVCGKILAGIVSISGVILLAFPISVIVENFNRNYLDPEDEETDADGIDGQEGLENGIGGGQNNGHLPAHATVMFVPMRKNNVVPPPRRRVYRF